MPQNNTPIWLELKPSFIDENFEKVLDYLSSSQTVHDNFYQETVLLLEKRVRLAIDDIRSAPLYAEDEQLTEEQQEVRYGDLCRLVRMVISFLLVSEHEHDLRPLAQAALFYYLIRLEPRHAEKLIACQLKILTNASVELPLSWKEDVHALNPSTLVFRLTNAEYADVPSELEYAGHGIAVTDKNHLNIYTDASTMRTQQVAKSRATIAVMNDLISVYTDNDHRIKVSEQKDYNRLEEFAASVSQLMSNQKPPILKQYMANEEVEVVVLSAAGGQMRVRTTAGEYVTIEGFVDFDYTRHKNTLTYDYRDVDFCSALKPGDLFDALLIDPQQGLFSIYEPFQVCHNDDGEVGAASMVDSDTIACAVGLWTDPHTNVERVRWLSREGYIIQSFSEDGIEVGNYAVLHIDNVRNSFVNATIVEHDAPAFDLTEAKHCCICNFSHDHINLVASQRTMHDAELRLLYGSLYFRQRQMSDVYERGLYLCCISALATMIGADVDRRYVAFLMSYLNNLVRFATRRGGFTCVKTLLADVPCVSMRLTILEILKATGDEQKGDYLSQLQEESSADELVLKLARLAEAYNHLEPVTGEKTLGFIRREMIASLSIASEENADLEENGGLFLGDESSTVEYKTSFIFPPKNNMRPNEERQKRNIAKGLCAFMNSNLGGTLYLGINDAGGVVGVEEDKRYLNLFTMDSYIRYVQDRLKPFFPSEYQCLDFEQEYDGKVLAIHVKPYQYGVAKLEGVAYHRWSNENRPMQQEAVEQLWNERQFSNKELIRDILSLTTAIEQRKCAILHGYNSSNSGQVKDRNVEPFAFSNNHRSIWCYDCDKHEVRVFSISRIGNVEVTGADWQNADQHRKLDEDIFRMSGVEKTHVVLELDMLARNLLLEEYPSSSSFLKEVTNSPSAAWVLDAEVCSMVGIGRFCLGLMSNIRILEGDALKDYLKAALQKGKESLD